MAKRLLLAVILSLTAAACATPQTDDLRRGSHGLPARAAVAKPVFFAQRTKECGPAALAMALVHSGVRLRPEDLVAEVYNQGREGSLTPAVLAAVRRHGRIAYPLNNLTDLLRSVHRGRPAIVLQNLGLRLLPRWHYAVIVGYDFGKETVTLHSGRTEFLEMALETFEHTWARGGHWALLTLRPGEFPDPVDEGVYVRAVAGVERAGRAGTAAKAYGAAVQRWPDNLIAWMGLGNSLYRLNRRRAAAAAFRSATLRHPGNAAAFNNLAHVLGELGRFGEAEAAARKAIALGGPDVATYRATLRDILARRKRNSGGKP